MDRRRGKFFTGSCLILAAIITCIFRTVGCTQSTSALDDFLNSAEDMAVEAGIIPKPPNCTTCEVKNIADLTTGKCAAVPHAKLLPDRCHCFNTFFVVQNYTGPEYPSFINVTGLCNDIQLFKVLISNETLVEKSLVSRGFHWYDFDFNLLTGEEQARLGFIPHKALDVMKRAKRQDATETTTAVPAESETSTAAAETTAAEETTAAAQTTTTVADSTIVFGTTTTEATTAAVTEATTSAATEATTTAETTTVTSATIGTNATEMPIMPTGMVTEAPSLNDTFSTTLPTSTTLPVVPALPPVQMILFPQTNSYGGYSLMPVPIQTGTAGLTVPSGTTGVVAPVASANTPTSGALSGTIGQPQSPLVAIAYPHGAQSGASGFGAQSLAGSVAGPGAVGAIPGGFSSGVLAPNRFGQLNHLWANMLGVPARSGTVPNMHARADRSENSSEGDVENDGQNTDDDVPNNDKLQDSGNSTVSTPPPPNALSKESTALIAGTSPEDCHQKCQNVENQSVCHMVCASKEDNKRNFGSFVSWSKAF